MDRDELARIALRYDTLMSRAMLRALGAATPRARGRADAAARNSRYDGATELMRQRVGVRL